MATPRPRPVRLAPDPSVVEELIAAGLAALTERHRDDPGRVHQVTTAAAWLRQRDGAPAGRRPRPLPDRLVFAIRTVAVMLDTSSKVVRSMAALGEIPARRLGGKWVIGPRGEFQAWLDGLPGTTATQALAALGQRALIAGFPNEMVETTDTEESR